MKASTQGLRTLEAVVPVHVSSYAHLITTSYCGSLKWVVRYSMMCYTCGF